MPGRVSCSPIRRLGFTVVELLVVIGIMLILTSLLVMGLKGAGKKAQVKASKALVESIKVAMDGYYAHFKDYPPDGYDSEGSGPGWSSPTAAGIPVGYPPRFVKGTASLIYFLCRPVVKVTWRGPVGDLRNQVKQTVGPFLTLKPENFSRGGFQPNFRWQDGNYWAPNNQGYILTEIIDAFHHPLCYDKVTAYNRSSPTPFRYFQPDRFQFYTGSTSTSGGTKGVFVHSDMDFMREQVLLLEDQERICPSNPSHDVGFSSMNYDEHVGVHSDPRFINSQANGGDGCSYQTLPPGSGFGGTDTTHEPKSVGNYDLWSTGPSYTNARDDLTSWD